jgi:penicillin amidase
LLRRAWKFWQDGAHDNFAERRMRADRGGIRWMKRIGWILLALVVLVVLALWFFLRGSLAQLDGKRSVAGLHGAVTIHRDALGVPSIAAGDRQDVAYATGFVHAQDRYFQMDLLRRVAAGELAELFGAKALPLDREHRLHRFRARAAQAYAQLPAADRALLERYAAGVNDGLNALGTRPFEYGLLAQAPRSWSAHDSLLVIWAMYFDLQGGSVRRELARGWLRDNATADQLAFLLPTATRRSMHRRSRCRRQQYRPPRRPGGASPVRAMRRCWQPPDSRQPSAAMSVVMRVVMRVVM